MPRRKNWNDERRPRVTWVHNAVGASDARIIRVSNGFLLTEAEADEFIAELKRYAAMPGTDYKRNYE